HLPVTVKYCTECGTGRSLHDPPLARAESEQRGERRHLSVLFCDVAESTPLSERFDPEEFREVLRTFQHVGGEAGRAHEGTVGQYVGDGVVAYFGPPFAHEDAACRAVRAGLDLLARLEEANATLEERHQVRLRVRVSVHSGIVVLGDMG